MSDDDNRVIAELIQKAMKAQTEFSNNPTQKTYDCAALAAAWALIKNNHELADIAVQATSLGNKKDKISKNYRKTIGLLTDLKNIPTTGIIENNLENGIVKIARPKGVIAAIVPSTNPLATTANNVINALKCGNAIIISPSPKAQKPVEKLIQYIKEQLKQCQLNPNLVQIIPAPATKNKTRLLLASANFAVVTGSQANVKDAILSTTPTIGVGVGNATVIIDETADIKIAAEKIAASKTFDNSTSCSAENSIIIVKQIKQKLFCELQKQGAYILNQEQRQKFIENHWENGKITKNLIAKDINVLIKKLKLPDFNKNDCDKTKIRFLISKETTIGDDNPICKEKIALLIGAYTVDSFQDAIKIAKQILNHQGAGHSIGIHSNQPQRAIELGKAIPVCRVIVNQPHCFATGGSFNNFLPFSLSMGCGSWGRNIIDDNLHWRHFINVTKVVYPIKRNEPSADKIFAKFWQQYGK